jgi:hypothetical protein
MTVKVSIEIEMDIDSDVHEKMLDQRHSFYIIDGIKAAITDPRAIGFKFRTARFLKSRSECIRA